MPNINLKYPHFNEYDTEKKLKALYREAELETHNGTKKEDLTNLVRFAAEYIHYLKAEASRPLTVEELKQMDGKPVYLQFGDGEQGWAIASYTGDDTSFGMYGIDFPNEYPDIDFYNMEHKDPEGHYGLHVLGWRAYRGNPNEEESE
jgi:hypothetical protein